MSEPPNPPPSAPPTLREARAAVFAALCVLVAALGHGAFSVGDIPVWALGTAVAVLYFGARLFTRRERGLAAILAAMALVQVGLHFFFVLAQSTAPMAMGSMPGMPARGTMWCGKKEPDLTSTYLHIGGLQPTHAHTMTAGMLAVHALTALAAAWWLRRGEAAAWSMARSVVLFVVAPLLVLFATVLGVFVRPTSAPAASAVSPLGRGVLLRHFVTRRGPPVRAAAYC